MNRKSRCSTLLIVNEVRNVGMPIVTFASLYSSYIRLIFWILHEFGQMLLLYEHGVQIRVRQPYRFIDFFWICQPDGGLEFRSCFPEPLLLIQTIEQKQNGTFLPDFSHIAMEGRPERVL